MFDEIISGLKGLAKTLNIPVVMLSQLSRQLETRQSKTPILADLKETGMIEQACDLVMATHRPSLFIKKKGKGESDAKFLCEVYILKQRNGPIGEIDLYFNQVFTRFENMNSEIPF